MTRRKGGADLGAAWWVTGSTRRIGVPWTLRYALVRNKERNVPEEPAAVRAQCRLDVVRAPVVRHANVRILGFFVCGAFRFWKPEALEHVGFAGGTRDALSFTFERERCDSNRGPEATRGLRRKECRRANTYPRSTRSNDKFPRQNWFFSGRRVISRGFPTKPV